MDLNLSEQQEILKKFARDFLKNQYPTKTIKKLEEGTGHSVEIWKELASLGWIGLPFPEKYGGSEMSFLDLAILLEEMGMACMVSPYFSSVVLGGLPINDFATEEQKQEYLPLISTGEKIFSFAFYEKSARFDAETIFTKAVNDKGSWIIEGTKIFVPYAHVADYLICAVKTGDSSAHKNNITLFIVDASNSCIERTLLNTRTDKVCEVKFNGVRVPANNILGKLNHGWNIAESVVNKAAVAKCCEMLGAAQKVMDMCVEYAKERRQFGRPIGSFQAIQHYCADMLTDIYGMRISSYRAAWMLSENLPCTAEIAVAKTWAAQVSERIVNVAHQIHGAIGFTMDYNLHYYTRRLKNSQCYFKDNNLYNDVLATIVK